MRLVSFSFDGRAGLGVLDGDDVIDLYAGSPGVPADMTTFLSAGADALVQAQLAVDRGAARLPAANVEFLPVVTRPGKFLAVGLNYAEHAAESGREPPEHPTIFNKQVSCVNGPYAPVLLPAESQAVDYEGELGIVIGERCRRVTAADAPSVIAGYTIVNDVSVRDWQRRTPTWTMGKSWDTHGPCGPCLVTPDEIGDPHALGIRTFVNGEKRQDSNTEHLIFNCFQIVEHLSTAFTLEPGDVIATGTPEGVGVAMQPPKYLMAGDIVRIEVDGIGHLENEFVAEPQGSAVAEHH